MRSLNFACTHCGRERLAIFAPKSSILVISTGIHDLGLCPTTSGPPKRICGYGPSCLPLMPLARSFGTTCRAQNWPITSKTLMFRASWALNQRSSYLQQGFPFT